MIQGKSLLGRSLVGQNDGKVLGTVKDLIFAHDSDEIVALVLADKDLFGLIDAIVVPWRLVRSISGDVIMVENAAAMMKLHEDPRTRELTQNPANRESVLSGTKVLSSSGEVLGTLADMCIDEKTGKVLGYAVSKGFVSDTLRGKKFIPAPPGLSVGPHAAIARPTAEAQIKGELPTNVSLPEVEPAGTTSFDSTSPNVALPNTTQADAFPATSVSDASTSNASLPDITPIPNDAPPSTTQTSTRFNGQSEIEGNR
jgi:uncharacterized protein YrrD